MEKKPVPKFRIREGKPEDVIAARAMQAKAWEVTYPNEAAGVSHEWVKNRTDTWQEPERLEESVKILAAILDDPTHYYRLAESNGEVVGFIHLRTEEDGRKHLEAIYTDPSTFGSGVGPALMEGAKKWIGDATTTLEVATYNDRAIRFYEKHGFKKIEGSEHLYRETMPVIDMIREGEHSEI